MTAHVTQRKDARALLKRNFKAGPPVNDGATGNRCAVRFSKRARKRFRACDRRAEARPARERLGLRGAHLPHSPRQKASGAATAQTRGGRSRSREWLASARSAAEAPQSAPEFSPWVSTRMRGSPGVTRASAPSSESSRTTAASVSSSRGSSESGHSWSVPKSGRAAQAATRGKPLKQRTLTTNNAVNRAKSRSARVTAPESCRGVPGLSSSGRDCPQARLRLGRKQVL